MHETQTAALVAADNSVILHFLQALWSYRIMQSLLWNKAFRSHRDLLFPEKQIDVPARLHMPKENNEADPKKRQKITINISVNHSVTPHTTIQHVSNLLGRSSSCSQTRSPAKVTWRCLPPVRDVAKPRFPLFLCLEIFLASHFYELISCSQEHKRQRLKAQPEAGRRTKSNRWLKKWPLCRQTDGRWRLVSLTASVSRPVWVSPNSPFASSPL